eukprot:gene39774-48426_t
MALLSPPTVRQATIRACQLCRIWGLDRQTVRNIAQAEYEKRMAERVAFLSAVELFANLLPSQLEKISEVMQEKYFSTGSRIIKQGEKGDAFYMIKTGRVSVTQVQGGSGIRGSLVGSIGGSPSASGGASGKDVELVKLGPGKYFGELALIENAPRKATVTAVTNVCCYTLDRHQFLSVFGSLGGAIQEGVGVKMLRRVKLLEPLSDTQLVSLARVCQTVSFSEGEAIIKQGERGQEFYMLVKGEVSVSVNHIQVAVLKGEEEGAEGGGGGAFFGEMALLSNEKRSATVTALNEVSCLVLSRADFDNLLGGENAGEGGRGVLEGILEASERRKQELLQKQRRSSSTSSLLLSQLKNFVGGSGAPESPTQRKKSISRGASMGGAGADMFSLDQLDKVRRLGGGTFGSVTLVQHYYTSKYYALKVYVKDTLFVCQQESNAFRERDCLYALSDSPFVVGLFASFQDEKCLYMVMQYLGGGDLHTLLYSDKLTSSKAGGWTTGIVQFYGANLLCAINHMHKLDIIHRDLKLENLMVDSSGFLKVVDFGCARPLPLSGRTHTLCGSPAYLCPEMILSRGYNRGADYWALGIALFEMMTRRTPFEHSNLAMLFQNILEHDEVLRLFFATAPPAFDMSLRESLLGLLGGAMYERLGMKHGGGDDIW